MDKPTVVVGASPNASRYSYRAVRSLQDHRFTVYAVGIHKGEINGTNIELNRPDYQNIHTVTLYVGPKNQVFWEDYILGLNPKRIIFNPGAENDDLAEKAGAKGIECINACTLVMLSIGAF
jgi:predicted CoA-binding protein